MEEKRRSKRLPIKLYLEVSSLFKQDNVRVDDLKAPIEVFNISKGGIGFTSSSNLPENYYFNAKIELGNPSSSLYVVIKIIRQQPEDSNRYIYGAEFVGMPSVLSYIFDEYEEKLKQEGELI